MNAKKRCCHLLLVAVQFSFAMANPIVLTNEYASIWGDELWKLDAKCEYVLTQDYNANSNPSGFRLVLNLEGHATGGIVVYWPFDNSKVYSVTTGDNRTEIQLPTHDTIVAVASTYQPQLLIDFINPDPYSYGNWPRGYCHGPYPLGDPTAATTDPAAATTDPTSAAPFSGNVDSEEYDAGNSTTTTASSTVTSPTTTNGWYGNVSSTTTPLKCTNKVGCYHCRVDNACPSMGGVLTTVDEHACYEDCERVVACLGIQYDFNTRLCMLFGYTEACHFLEYTTNATISVYRKSCRSDCSLFILEAMSTTGWSFNASHSYHVSRVDNAGHCIGECLENNTCNGVLYNTTNDICNHFDNCATEECLVPETPSAFSVNEPYLITCLQGVDPGLPFGTTAGINPVLVAITEPVCTNKVGCYHCRIETSCFILAGGSASNQQECWESCELNEKCLGIQFDYNTQECTFFNDSDACYNLQFTPEEIYVYRKSCRNDCPMNEVALLPGWSFNKSLSIDKYSVESAGDCLGDCFDRQFCNGALYESGNNHCHLFANCSTQCLVQDISGQSEAYQFFCRQECDIIDDPAGGTVNLTGTMNGHIAHYVCDAGLQLAGDNQRQCVMGTWQGPEPSCELIPIVSSTPFLLTSVGSETIAATIVQMTEMTTTPLLLTSIRPETITATAVQTIGVIPTDPVMITTVIPTIPAIDPTSFQVTATSAMTPSTISSAVSTAYVTMDSTTLPSSTIQTSLSATQTSTLTTMAHTSIPATLPSVVSSSPSTTVSPKPIYIWPCLCSNRSFAGLTQDVIIEQLVNDVKINPKETQLAISKKVCMKDSRTSSTSMGILAITLIATFASFVVILDLIGRVSLACPCCNQVKTKSNKKGV